MKVLGFIPWGLIGETIVTPNDEKSDDIIVRGNAEGLNNIEFSIWKLLLWLDEVQDLA